MNERYWAPVITFYIAAEGTESLLRLLDASGQKLNDVYQAAGWMAELPGEEQWSQNVLIRLGRSCLDADRPPAARQRAAAALAATGDPGVAALMSQVIRQFEPAMRQVALAVMARVSSSETVSVARRLFADSDSSVRVAAIHAIAWTAEPEADKVLDEALLLTDQVLSQAAAEGLALNGTEADYRSLRRAATDRAFNARRSALAGLRLIDEPWAIEFLTKLGKGDEAPAIGADVQDPAKRWHRSRAGDQPWLVAWAVAQGRVVPVGQAAIPFLLEALQDSEAAIRQRAAATLGQLASVDGTTLLRRALQDESPDVRQSAYVALAKIARAWTPDD
jgi:HEAT repeat protein